MSIRYGMTLIFLLLCSNAGRMYRVLLIVFALIACNARFVFGSIIIEEPVRGTPHNGTVVKPIVGGGDDQVGMLVTVVYNTFTETISWTSENDKKGGTKSSRFEDSWELFSDVEGGNGQEGTFGDEDETLVGNKKLDNVNEHWEFKHDEGKLPNSSRLLSITLDGVPAGIVFDRPVLSSSLISTPYNPTEPSGDGSLGNPRPHEGTDKLANFSGSASEFGTVESQRGRDFYTPEFDNADEHDVSVTYSNLVGIFGDLYTTVTIVSPDGLRPSNVSSFNFAIDTDKTSGLTAAVPEPSSFAFSGIVVFLVAGVKRIRSRWSGLAK